MGSLPRLPPLQQSELGDRRVRGWPSVRRSLLSRGLLSGAPVPRVQLRRGGYEELRGGQDWPGVWLHVDMAAPAYTGDRATGYGIALLNCLLAAPVRPAFSSL